jgi:adenylate cyclase class IV
MPKAKISLLNALGGGPLVVVTKERKGDKIVKKAVTISDVEDVGEYHFPLVILRIRFFLC